ncbi:hypothetical protein [Peptoniphilus catoniae]|uniref:hypothetical protein n=1 Tax=Peptoniphilus catoniae TaxID=1660341 RepID=UPI0010FD6B71|nr:hypothetical protein [Peptoniphilus catoniae]
MIANYYGEDWLFVSDILVKIDGNFYNPYNLIDPTFDREVCDGGVSESNVVEIANLHDFVVVACYYDFLSDICNSKETVVCFSGKSRSEYVTISSKDKKAIREVLDAWETIVEMSNNGDFAESDNI